MMMWWLHEFVKEKHDYINQSLTPLAQLHRLYIVRLSAQQRIILISNTIYSLILRKTSQQHEIQTIGGVKKIFDDCFPEL
jgi:hypothetical protein